MRRAKDLFQPAVGVWGSRLSVRGASGMTHPTTDQLEVRPFEEIPGPRGPYQWPVIGTLLLFKPFSQYTAETVHKMVDAMFQRYGPVVKLQLGKQVIMACDPKDIETVFRNEGKFPHRPPFSLEKVFAERNNLTRSLTMAQGEDWYTYRAPMNRRLMKTDSAHHYLEPQNRVADDFVHILSTRHLKPEEISDLFFRYASESIGVVTFNVRLGFMSPNPDEDTKTFLQASQDIFNTMNKSMNGESIAHTWYKNKTYREFERASGIITKNSAKHAAQARKVIEEQTKAGTLNPDEPNLLLSLSAEKGLDFDQVAMIIDTLYVAGTDSTAKNLQTLFYNLATNPDKQEKLRQEIHDVIGHDGPVTPPAISEMTYLKACLKESFRLHPPTVGVTMRILPTDVVLSGYRVPSGVPVILGNTTAGKMYFDNPQQYNPERWLRSSDGRKQENIPSSAVLPFGHGPRNCVGQRFAVQEIYLAASKVLQKLKIELERDSWNTEFIYKVFITPKQPLKFRFTKLVG